MMILAKSLPESISSEVRVFFACICGWDCPARTKNSNLGAKTLRKRICPKPPMMRIITIDPSIRQSTIPPIHRSTGSATNRPTDKRVHACLDTCLKTSQYPCRHTCLDTCVHPGCRRHDRQPPHSLSPVYLHSKIKGLLVQEAKGSWIL